MGTAEILYNEIQDDYKARENSAKKFADFKKTKGYCHCFQTGRERAAADLDGIWSAVSLEGVVYPFPRTNNHKQELAYDDYLAIAFARHALAGDATEIGKIVLEQIHNYMNEAADEFVEDNWEQWAAEAGK